MDKMNILAIIVRKMDGGLELVGKRGSELPPEQLCPQIMLASFYVCPPPYTASVNIPGLNMYLVLEGKMRFNCSDGTTGVASGNDLVTFYAGVNGYEVVSRTPLSIYQVVFYPAHPPLAQSIPSIPGLGKLPHLVDVGKVIPQCIEAFERMIEALLRLDVTWRFETSSAILDLLKLTFSALLSLLHNPILTSE